MTHVWRKLLRCTSHNRLTVFFWQALGSLEGTSLGKVVQAPACGMLHGTRCKLLSASACVMITRLVAPGVMISDPESDSGSRWCCMHTSSWVCLCGQQPQVRIGMEALEGGAVDSPNTKRRSRGHVCVFLLHSHLHCKLQLCSKAHTHAGSVILHGSWLRDAAQPVSSAPAWPWVTYTVPNHIPFLPPPPPELEPHCIASNRFQRGDTMPRQPPRRIKSVRPEWPEQSPKYRLCAPPTATHDGADVIWASPRSGQQCPSRGGLQRCQPELALRVPAVSMRRSGLRGCSMGLRRCYLCALSLRRCLVVVCTMTRASQWGTARCVNGV